MTVRQKIHTSSAVWGAILDATTQPGKRLPDQLGNNVGTPPRPGPTLLRPRWSSGPSGPGRGARCVAGGGHRASASGTTTSHHVERRITRRRSRSPVRNRGTGFTIVEQATPFSSVNAASSHRHGWENGSAGAISAVGTDARCAVFRKHPRRDHIEVHEYSPPFIRVDRIAMARRPRGSGWGPNPFRKSHSSSFAVSDREWVSGS